MNICTAICDDLPTDREVVSQYLKRWADSRGHTITLSMFSSAESFLFAFDDSKAYELLLLDIEMEKINGVELAGKIRQVNREVQIVFISGYSDYISDGYDVDALNYILKPVKYEKLEKVLDKAAERIQSCEKAIFLETADGIERVPLYDIVYIDVYGNYVTVHTTTKEYKVKQTLAKIEKELDGRFFKTNRSYIVGMRFIQRTSRTEVTLTTGDVIPLSRGLYDKLNQAFIKHF